MIDIGKIASNLEKDHEGLWVSSERSEVSYPKQGNVECFRLEDDSFWFTHRNRCIVEVLRRFPPKGPVFDVGGGNGLVSKAMMGAGFEAVLVEPGHDGARNALARGVAPVVQAALQDCGLAPETLPAAGLFDVLEHQEGDVGFLSYLRRLLVPGGRLYLTVPAHTLLWSENDVRSGHFRRYSAGALRRVLRGAGFEIEFLTHIFWCLPPAIFFFRTLPAIFGIGSGGARERARKEHSPPDGLGSRLLRTALDAEWRALSRGRYSPIGSSCLAAARALPRST